MAVKDRRNGMDIHGVPADWKRYSNTSDNHSLPLFSLILPPSLSVVQTDLISLSLSAGWLLLSSSMLRPSPQVFLPSLPPFLPLSLHLFPPLSLSLFPPHCHDVFWSFCFSDKTGTELQRIHSPVQGEDTMIQAVLHACKGFAKFITKEPLTYAHCDAA